METPRQTLLNIWNKMPLNRKFSTLLVSLLILPTLLSLFYIFNSMRVEIIEDTKNSVQDELTNAAVFIEANRQTTTSIMQSIIANTQLTDYLSGPVSSEELVTLGRTMAPYLEALVYTNGYVRSLRIYSDASDIPELWPVFVDIERVNSIDWYGGIKPDSTAIRVDYSEKLSDATTQLSGENLISFATAIDTDTAPQPIVEVSYTMSDFFGTLYKGTAENYSFFCRNDTLYLHEENQNRSDIAHFALENFSSDADTITYMGRQYVLRSSTLDGMGGELYVIHDITDAIRSTYNMQMLLYVIIFIFFIIMYFFYGGIVRIFLKRIYSTISAMRAIEKGKRLDEIEGFSSEDTDTQQEKLAYDESEQLQYYFKRMAKKIDVLIEQNTKRALLEKDAEIKALQNQINSHFLYNVLNNIEMMAIIDNNDNIADTVTSLGRLLRYSMNWKKQMVPLAQELAYVEDYVKLFNMRFDNEIRLLFAVDEIAHDALVPKMCIQPIVENAIVHGIEHRDDKEIIQINAKINDDVLTIRITDTGIGMSEQTVKELNEKLQNPDNSEFVTGIGLVNVHERLERRFGKEYGIVVESKENLCTKITMTMPFRSVSDE